MEIKGVRRVELQSDPHPITRKSEKGVPQHEHTLVLEFENGRKISISQSYENVIEIMRAAT